MLVRANTTPLRTRPRVQRASGIPCALCFREVANITCKPRVHRAARMRKHVWTPVIARSACDEAIHSFFAWRHGLLRFARNDVEGTGDDGRNRRTIPNFVTATPAAPP